MLDFILNSVGVTGIVLTLLGGFLLTRYKRCPSNQILVIYGKVSGGKSAKCVHGGGSFVLPIIQDWQFLSLNPLPIDIDLRGALSKQNIRINTPSTFTVAISTREDIMLNAAERLLSLDEEQIKIQALDIILGQLRLVIATLTIEEINQDREQFLQLIHKHVTVELNKVGLELINVNIKDITDESGYIEAIGKKAASEAINKAKVEVAQQDRNGEIGQVKAEREREVQVALERAQKVEGMQDAESKKRIALADLELKASVGESEAASKRRISLADLDSKAIVGESRAEREKQVLIAMELAKSDEGKKDAESKKRITIANLEALAIEGENLSKAKVVEANTVLSEKNAEALRRSEVANAVANTQILEAQKVSELAKLEKDQIVRMEIDKRKKIIEAEAEAEQTRTEAKGEADAILLKYQAESEGLQKLLSAKALGYKHLIDACGGDQNSVATLLLIEKMESIIAKQTEAISNLKIDKITVWDSGSGGANQNATANFMRGMMGSLPPIHELAKQAGIELPSFLGNMTEKHIPEAKTE